MLIQNSAVIKAKIAQYKNKIIFEIFFLQFLLLSSTIYRLLIFSLLHFRCSRVKFDLLLLYYTVYILEITCKKQNFINSLLEIIRPHFCLQNLIWSDYFVWNFVKKKKQKIFSISFIPTRVAILKKKLGRIGMK